MFSRDLGLDAAPGIAVLGDDDGAFYGNSQPLQFLVVLGQAVVDENQRGGHVAIDRVGVVGGQLFALLIGGGIYGDRRLLQLGGELRRLDHFEHAFFGRRKQHVEGFDVRVPAPLLELRQNPFGVLLVIRRADVMRARAQAPHVLALVVRAGNGAKF